MILGITLFIYGLGNTVNFFEGLGNLGFSAYVGTFIKLIGGTKLIVGIEVGKK